MYLWHLPEDNKPMLISYILDPSILKLPRAHLQNDECMCKYGLKPFKFATFDHLQRQLNMQPIRLLCSLKPLLVTALNDYYRPSTTVPLTCAAVRKQTKTKYSHVDVL